MSRTHKPKEEKMSARVTVRMTTKSRRAIERLRKQESRRLGRKKAISAGEYLFEGRRKQIDEEAGASS